MNTSGQKRNKGKSKKSKTVVSNVKLLTPTSHHEVVSLLRATQHKQQRKNMAEQSLSRILKMKQSNENTTAGGTSVPKIGRTYGVNNTHKNCLRFRDDHLFPVFPSQQSPKKYIDDDYN